MATFNYIVDAHQHFWKYDPVNYAWISEEMANIRKDFTPSDLQKTFKENKVDYAVYVQVEQHLQETLQMINIAKKNDFIKGLVGWVDFKAQNIQETLLGFSQEKLLKGFRHIVQGEADPVFLLDENFNKGISLLKKYDFTYDILVYPHQLPAVLEFIDKHPNQKFVIDHLAKPYIKMGYYKSWALMMRAISEREHVFCKLSGMVTEADFKNWNAQQIAPYMEMVLEFFGTDRTMFGSDWPVCLVAANYKKVKDLVVNFIGKLSHEEQNKIMGLNAKEFYKLHI